MCGECCGADCVVHHAPIITIVALLDSGQDEGAANQVYSIGISVRRYLQAFLMPPVEWEWHSLNKSAESHNNKGDTCSTFVYGNIRDYEKLVLLVSNLIVTYGMIDASQIVSLIHIAHGFAPNYFIHEKLFNNTYLLELRNDLWKLQNMICFKLYLSFIGANNAA